MREDIMTTYKELKAIKESFDRAEKASGGHTTKFYWVGIDECGIMVVTLDIHGIKGLDNVQTVEASNSQQARLLYASTISLNMPLRLITKKTQC